MSDIAGFLGGAAPQPSGGNSISDFLGASKPAGSIGPNDFDTLGDNALASKPKSLMDHVGDFASSAVPSWKDFQEGMMGRAIGGIGQRVHDFFHEGKSLAQLDKEGVTFKPMPDQPHSLPVGEALRTMWKEAQKNPGKTLGEFVKGMVTDPEIFFLPEFGAEAKLGQVAGKIAGRYAAKAGQVAGSGAELAAKGAALETTAQAANPNKRMDPNTIGTTGAMWGVPGSILAFVRKNPHVAEAVSSGNAEAAEGIFRNYKAQTGNPEGMTKEEVLKQIHEHVTGGKGDAHMNAERKANDLMQRGASLKEVEAAVKKDPLVGEKMEAIRQQRQWITEQAKGGEQGELLGPEQKSEAFRESLAQGDKTQQGSNRPALPNLLGKLDNTTLAGLGAVSAGAALTAMYPDDDKGGMALLGGMALATHGKLNENVLREPAPALGEALKASSYTFKTLERLPQNRATFPKQMIEEQLKRQDVSGPERETMRAILNSVPGDSVDAVDLVKEFKKQTGDHELEHRASNQYADYGLGNVDREHGSGFDSAQTNLYRLPEHIEVPGGNHFGDSRLFGWTRSFDDGKQRYVAEVQSDLAQHAKTANKLDGGERQVLRDANVKNQQQIDYLKEHRQILDSNGFDMDRFYQLLGKMSGPNPDAPMMIAHNIFRKLGEDGPDPSNDWAYLGEVSKRAEAGDAASYHVRGAIKNSLKDFQMRLEAKLAENNNKINAESASEKLSPVLKNWPRRLIREELARAATPNQGLIEHARTLEEGLAAVEHERQNGIFTHTRDVWEHHKERIQRKIEAARGGAAPKETVRFATADTVAKVEGWGRKQEYTPGEAIDPGLKGRRLSGSETSNAHNWELTGKVRMDSDGMWAAERVAVDAMGRKYGEPKWGFGGTALISDEIANKFVKESKSFSDPGHQSIYDRYNKEITKYLKSLGGKEVTDSRGETWIEVPTKPFGGRKEMYGKADPKLLAGLAAAGVGALAGAAMSDQKWEAAALGAAVGGLLARGIGGSLAKAKQLGEFGKEFWKPDFSKDLGPETVGRALNWTRMSSQADTTLLWQHSKMARIAGVTPQMDRKFRDYSEGTVKSLTPQEKALYDRYVGPMREAIADELNKIADPKERKIVADEIQTRLAKNHRAWWEALTASREGQGPAGFGRTPGIVKGRSVFAMPDGTIITTKPVPGRGYQVTGWKDGKPTPLGFSKEPIKAGTEFRNTKIVDAKQADIERHSPVRYVESDVATHAVKLSELQRYNRERGMIQDLLNSPEAKNLFKKEGEGPIPPDWVRPDGAERIPGLAGVHMPKPYAEVISDFIKRSKGGDILEGVKNIMIRSFMINPYPHIMNEVAHWWDARGLSGFVTPTGIPGGASGGLIGLAKTMPDSIRSVIVQDAFQIELQKSGGYLLQPSVRNGNAWVDIMQAGVKDALKTQNFKEIAKSLGMLPARLADKISSMSSTIMWGFRDILYTQLVKEQMLTGKSVHEAATEVGRHMPEYYIPSRIISKGEAGRVASQFVQSPLFVFSAYHYGLARAIKEIGKEILTGGERAKGFDRAAALLAGWYILFPLADKVFSAMTDRDVKERRSGPYHVVDTAGQIMDDKKAPTAIMASLLTPNPAWQSAYEVLNNRYGFSGQPIIYPGSSGRTQAIDAGRYVASKIAPVQSSVDVKEGRQTGSSIALRQLDLIEQTPDKKAREVRAMKFIKQEAKSHEKKINRTYGH